MGKEKKVEVVVEPKPEVKVEKPKAKGKVRKPVERKRMRDIVTILQGE